LHKKRHKLREIYMVKAALASAIALVTIGTTLATAQTFREHGSVTRETSLSFNASHIGRLKSALHLTAKQEAYWRPVEAVLRDIVRHKPDNGSTALDAAALRRLASAAMPLIRSLDEEQKRNATRFVQSIGLAHLAWAF
jgi:hypothetical protein